MTPIALLKKAHAGRRPKSLDTDNNTRTAILTAARSVFAQKGFEGTTIREVAKAARVNNAMIYYFFKDKSDLYRSVIAYSFTAFAAIWKNDIFRSSEPVRKKIETFIDAYIRFHQKNEDLRRIMAMEFAGSWENVCWICEEYFAECFSPLTELFREGIRTGELKQLDPGMALTSLMGIVVHNFIMLPYAEQIQKKKMTLSQKKFGAFVKSLFFEGMGNT